jgi:uncharacterized protein YdeI (YjbR/CyaY-like superfamily)
MSAPEVVEPATREEWREWLQAHAASAAEIWLVIPHAGSGRPGISHRQAIEEALCFGWIDSMARRHDDSSWRQRFSPRRPTAHWSKINRELVEQLTAQGRMTAAGQAAVDLAKRTGTWSALAEAQDGVVPDDLRSALDADPAAAAGFAAQSPSARRAALESVARAVRPSTRQRRIAAIVARAAGDGPQAAGDPRRTGS